MTLLPFEEQDNLQVFRLAEIKATAATRGGVVIRPILWLLEIA
jgi:hypothetical protein